MVELDVALGRRTCRDSSGSGKKRLVMGSGGVASRLSLRTRGTVGVTARFAALRTSAGSTFLSFMPLRMHAAHHPHCITFAPLAAHLCVRMEEDQMLRARGRGILVRRAVNVMSCSAWSRNR